MKLSIIIVSWNVCHELLECLQSIRENPPSESFEVIVVDNASTDETVDTVTTHFPEVVLAANTHNRGFAAANNEGIQKSQGQYILLLNPDTIVHLRSLDILVTFMDDHKDVGTCGPRLLNSDGTTQQSARRFPSFRGALNRHTAFGSLGIFRGQYRKWLMKDLKCDGRTDVDQVMGAALMTRRSVIEQVGLMDEGFFMYYEEVDWCYRIKQAGSRITYVPEAEITHLAGRSTGQVPAGKRIMAMTSLLLFFRKHRGPLATGVFSCVFKPALAVRDLMDIITGLVKYTFAALTLNKKNREKSADKIKKAATLLSKYSWRSLFRV
ncbi:MAG: glycosyltransferase family 2 protein [Planctomycetota bacterium]|jgi:GT2 family glycosyltransferase